MAVLQQFYGIAHWREIQVCEREIEASLIHLAVDARRHPMNHDQVETIVCQSATPQLPTIAYLLTVVGPQGAAFELSVALLNVTVELGSVHYGSFPNKYASQ